MTPKKPCCNHQIDRSLTNNLVSDSVTTNFGVSSYGVHTPSLNVEGCHGYFGLAWNHSTVVGMAVSSGVAN